MRTLFSTVAFLVAYSPVALADSSIAGHWSRGDGAARVRIHPCGAALCAVNTWVKDPKGGEKVGDRLVLDVVKKTPTNLSGTAYDPQRRLTYSIDIRVSQNSMTTRGCVLGGLLCKAVAWAK